MNKKQISARIKELIGTQPVATFAKRCGISESLLRQYLAGSVPGLDKAILISRAAGVTLDWLATGEGSRKKSKIERDGAIKECMGTTKDHREVRGVDVLCFKPDWIHTELKAAHTDLCLFAVEGESMGPTFRPGDIIVVDLRDTGPACDGIYVLMIDGGLTVKRLQILPGGISKVTSDNQAYASFEVNLKTVPEHQFKVMGRVVWAGRKI